MVVLVARHLASGNQLDALWDITVRWLVVGPTPGSLLAVRAGDLWVHACVRAFVRACVRSCVCECMSVCICVYVYMCVRLFMLA